MVEDDIQPVRREDKLEFSPRLERQQHQEQHEEPTLTASTPMSHLKPTDTLHIDPGKWKPFVNLPTACR